MPLPNDLSSFHKSNAGLICYHNAVQSLAGSNVPIAWTNVKRREGLTAGQASSEYLKEHKEGNAVQMLMEAWELILERGEATDVSLQMRQHSWLNKMNETYG